MMERFKPEVGQPYHYVTHYGSVEVTRWVDDTSDHFRYDVGNCFRTHDEAKGKIDRDAAITSGRAVVVDLPEGWELDRGRVDKGIAGLYDYEADRGYGGLVVCVKRTPTPPPPKEIVVRVYDVETHGDPVHGRLYVYIGKGLYIYPNEAEGL